MPCSVCDGSSFLSSYTSFSECFSLNAPSEFLFSSVFVLDSGPFYPFRKQLSVGTPPVTVAVPSFPTELTCATKMEERGSSEMKVPLYKTSQWYISEHKNLYFFN
jgi:hypothetical protein